MDTIVAFSSNLKLESLNKIEKLIPSDGRIVFVTSHKLLENESRYVRNLFPGSIFIYFGEILSDAENAECDYLAYELKSDTGKNYMEKLNELKNEKIVTNLIAKYPNATYLLLADDLGFDKFVWISHGFRDASLIFDGIDYYYDWGRIAVQTQSNMGSVRASYFGEEVHVAERESITYIALGSLNRISYFIDLSFQKSDDMLHRLQSGEIFTKKDYQFLIAIHETFRGFSLPNIDDVDIRYIQDGYLPPNFSARDGKFHPSNVRYYAQDAIGLEYFARQGESATIPSIFKKIYMPLPHFPSKIQTVLFAVNCAGPWSAQINRSDDDLMVEAAAVLAMIFPNINFIYRCHPTCICPTHAGVNSIERIARYFAFLGLKNLHLSTNMPIKDLKGMNLSLGSFSLLEDIERADLVVAEYSHSLLEAAMEKKLFVSVNLTNRRNFFECVSDMGFPHCTNLSEMACLLRYLPTNDFRASYTKAVERYNEMIAITSAI